MNVRRLDAFLAAVSLSLWGACADSATAPHDRIVEGVNVSRLFAPPSQAEVTAMLDEWTNRDVQARGIQEVESTTVSLGTTPGTLRIVSHDVGGVRHFGAILAPSGAAARSLPVLVIAHGGDHGVDLSVDALPFLQLAFGDLVDDFVYVAPSFRSERLSFSGRDYVSGGEQSPWDRDVDDALALLNVALQTTPQADSGRIGVLGFSRGACVALLMGIRDSRIDLVAEYFGPTDFFGPFVQGAVEQALRGSPPDLPGADYINATFIQPLKRGELSIADVRPELLRRSPADGQAGRHRPPAEDDRDAAGRDARPALHGIRAQARSGGRAARLAQGPHARGGQRTHRARHLGRERAHRRHPDERFLRIQP